RNGCHLGMVCSQTCGLGADRYWDAGFLNRLVLRSHRGTESDDGGLDVARDLAWYRSQWMAAPVLEGPRAIPAGPGRSFSERWKREKRSALGLAYLVRDFWRAVLCARCPRTGGTAWYHTDSFYPGGCKPGICHTLPSGVDRVVPGLVRSCRSD